MKELYVRMSSFITLRLQIHQHPPVCHPDLYPICHPEVTKELMCTSKCFDLISKTALLILEVHRLMCPTFDTLNFSRCPTLVKFIEASDITKEQL